MIGRIFRRITISSNNNLLEDMGRDDGKINNI